jgi:hypothetical protein
MIWVVLIASELWLGFELTHLLLSHKFDTYLQMAFSAPVGFCSSVWLFYFCSIILRLNLFHCLLHFALLSVLSFSLAIRRLRRSKLSFQLPSPISISLASISVLLLFYLLPQFYFPKPHAVPHVLFKDFTPDLAILASFTRGCNHRHGLRVSNPLESGVFASSNWFASFHSAMLIAARASERCSLIAPTLFLLASFAVVYHRFASNFASSEMIGALSLALFFTVGGLGWTAATLARVRKSKWTDYVYCIGGNQFREWGNALLSYLLPIRCSQYSLAIVAAMLLCLQRGVFEFAGALSGLLVGIQGELVPFLLLFMAVHFWANKVNGRQFIVFASIVGLWQIVVWIGARAPVRVCYFWQSFRERGIFFGPFLVWLNSLGIFAILAIAFVWGFLDLKQRTAYLPSFAVWCLSNFVVVAGSPRLNIIVLYPLWISVAVPVVLVALKSWCRTPADEQLQGAVAAFCVLFVFAMSFGSVLGIRHQSGLRKEFWSVDLEDAGKWIVKSSEKGDVFMSYYAPFEIASTFAGRRVYTVDPESKRAADVVNWLKAGMAIPGISYFIECEEFPAKERVNFSAAHWQVVFKNLGVTIYKPRAMY